MKHIGQKSCFLGPTIEVGTSITKLTLAIKITAKISKTFITGSGHESGLGFQLGSWQLKITTLTRYVLVMSPSRAGSSHSSS